MQEKKESGALRKLKKIVLAKSGDTVCRSGCCIHRLLNYDFGKQLIGRNYRHHRRIKLPDLSL